MFVLSGVAVAAAPDLGKENKEEIDEAVLYSKVVPASSVGVVSENGGSTHFVRVSVATSSGR